MSPADRRRTLLALAVPGALLASPALQAADPEECGDVTIARMNWASAEVIAEIDRIILEEGYGCNASLVTGDTVPTFTSMKEKGDPDLAPEVWVNSIREPLAEAVDAGELIVAAQTLPDGGIEGWWIPKHLADANPDIRTIEDALARPELFPAPEDDSVGAVHGCPAGWTCQITTENLFEAFGAGEKGFVLVDTGSSAGLDGSISRAVEREEGWLGYYWSPTALLGRYEMVRLETPEHDPAEWKRCTAELGCPDPEPNGFPADGGVQHRHRQLRRGGERGDGLHRGPAVEQRHRQPGARLDGRQPGDRGGGRVPLPRELRGGLERLGGRGDGRAHPRRPVGPRRATGGIPGGASRAQSG